MPKVLSVALTLVASGALAAQSPSTATPSAPSPEMSVADFFARVDELRVRGPNWTQSAEAGELFNAVSEAGRAYRSKLADQLSAGQLVEACLPPEAEIDSDVLFAHLAAYPVQSARQTSIATAFADLVKKRFPCR
jgi:hypothetical protein